MISYIKGILAEKNSDNVVLECGGVGFKIYTSYTTLCDTQCVKGKEVVLRTYMYIREGIMDLYGFISSEELELFELLISVSGVGAKGAVAVLSAMNPVKLSMTIVSGDVSALKKAPGIGPKTAQRIILELKDKIKNDAFISSPADAFSEVVPATSNEREEAVNALISLGYSATEARSAVSKAGGDNVEDIIKFALKNLM